MGRRPERAGFTVIELMLSAAVLTLVLGSVVMATLRGSGSFQRSMANGAIDSAAGRAMNRIARELVGASTSSLDPIPDVDFGSSSITFERPVGWAGGAPVMGPAVRIALELEQGELDNGLDDNGNGLVDEGRIVRIEDPLGPDPRRTVLVHRVSEYLEGETPNNIDDNGNGLRDERGLSFQLVGDTLTIRLSLERVGPDMQNMDAARRVIERTLETSVALRN